MGLCWPGSGFRPVAFPPGEARETGRPARRWLQPWFPGAWRIAGRSGVASADGRSGRGGRAGCARRLGRRGLRGCGIAEGICGKEYRRVRPLGCLPDTTFALVRNISKAKVLPAQTLTRNRRRHGKSRDDARDAGELWFAENGRLLSAIWASVPAASRNVTPTLARPAPLCPSDRRVGPTRRTAGRRPGRTTSPARSCARCSWPAPSCLREHRRHAAGERTM